MSSTTKFEKILLATLIFLIPSNLALHFTSLARLVDGVLVDYLIPRLYLTDIIIILLFGLSFLNPKSSILNLVNKVVRSSNKNVKISLVSKNHKFSSYQLKAKSYKLIIAFFTITLLTSFFAPNPQASLWFWLKLLEMTLLFLYLRSIPLYAIRYTLYAALTLSVLFQSLLALAQYLRQASLFPYFLLGESQFSSTTPGIAKGAFFGALKVLPYGTTPHPNVLAGFLAVSLVTLYILRKHARKKSKLLTISNYATAIFGFSALILTQSVSALGICTLAIAAISYRHYSSTQKVKPLKPLFFLAGAVVLIGVWLFLKTILEPESLSRRLALNQAAIRMLANHPLLGVGLNNFTAMLSTYGEVEGPIRFLQPVHNIYLLLAAETGLIGFGIVSFIILKLTQPLNFLERLSHLFEPEPQNRRPERAKRYVKRMAAEGSPPLYLPLLMMLIIGAVDHYPLTLQTGQLLTMLTIALVKPHTKT